MFLFSVLRIGILSLSRIWDLVLRIFEPAFWFTLRVLRGSVLLIQVELGGVSLFGQTV